MSDQIEVGRRRSIERTELDTALKAAVRAPSIYNSQPWRFRVGNDAVDVHADPSRHLHVVDPDRHSMLISVGAVVAALQYALDGQGWASSVEHHDPSDSEHVATVRVMGSHPTTTEAGKRAEALARRFSDRRPFASTDVPEDVLDDITIAAAAEHVSITVMNSQDEYIGVTVAMSRAAEALSEDPAYRAELSDWVRTDDEHDDGFSRSAIPHLTSGRTRHTDVALRDLGGQGDLEIDDVDERPSLAIIATQDSGPAASVAAGEAMLRLMVEAEVRGVMTCAISQAVDLPAMRAQLQTLLGWTAHPQMIVRLGYPRSDPRPPHTRRRPLPEVVVYDAPLED